MDREHRGKISVEDLHVFFGESIPVKMRLFRYK